MRIPQFFASNRKESVRIIIGIVATILIIYVVIRPLFKFSNLYRERADFAFYSETENDVAVNRSISRLKEYRAWSRKAIKIPLLSWGFEWFSDKYVFDVDALYEARKNYLIGDYDKAIAEVADRSDPESMTLIGASRFRIIQIEYLEKIGVKGANVKTLREEYVKRVIGETKSSFESALRADPDGPHKYKWNYDLISDPDAVRKAIEGNKAPTLFILGQNNPDNEGINDVPRLDEKSNPGDSDSKRKS